MEGRPEEQKDDSGLPQPGTEEPDGSAGDEDRGTAGPGNVSVDEPTAAALAEREDDGGDDDEPTGSSTPSDTGDPGDRGEPAP